MGSTSKEGRVEPSSNAFLDCLGFSDCLPGIHDKLGPLQTVAPQIQPQAARRQE